jgi:signal transduction histidine kinase
VPRFKRLSPVLGIKMLSRRMPLELKLPLLMSAVLALVLTIVIAVTYTTLRRNVFEATQERLTRATRQIAQVSGTAVAGQQPRYVTIGNDSVIRRALRDPTTSPIAVREALSRAAQPTDSGMPVELWTADGRRIGYAGNDVRSVPLVAKGRPELPLRISTTFDTSSRITAPDSMRVGPMYEEQARIHFWFVQPVRDRDQTIGYVTHQRRISSGANTQRILQELSGGDSVVLYYRNVDGSYWTSMSGKPMAPLERIDTARARSSGGTDVLYREERIGKTPLMVGMYLPTSAVLARPRATMRTVLLLSLVLLLGGAIASWLIGRSVARPLGDLTRAAGTLATGDYAVRVPERGDVEVRRLAQTFNHMAAEIGASREALEHQKLQAEAESNAKSEFLTTMSHELRTPLNAIGGYVDLIEMGLRGPLTDLQRRDLARIKTSQEHLLGLISGVLDLARVEAGKVSYDTTHIAVDPFLAGLDALIAPQAAAKSVVLDYVGCREDLAVVGDREKLRQILLNLLSNAIRHTPAGGRVTLSAEARGSRVAIMVEDTGPGIPADKQETIFEPFVQLDRSLTQHREGLGLGLTISRDLARGMQGDLVAEAGKGGGARFVLTLRRGVVDAAANALLVSGETPASHRP